ncbi:MAG: hypothetical protein NXI31_08315 [bacterium]|nr:hypothetical protein [bacterium]
MSTLIAVLLPAVLMPVMLWLARGLPGMPRLLEPGSWPAELWILAVGGLVATVAGVLDWSFHRRGGRRIPAAEHRAELMALVLGVPLFTLLAIASVVAEPAHLLVPIVATALAMAGLIAFDETRFHRACGRYETLLHRLLVGGNGVAFLAWVHWCFTRDAVGA